MKRVKDWWNVYVSKEGKVWEELSGNIFSKNINGRYPRCSLALLHYDKYGYAIYTMKKEVCKYNKIDYCRKKYKVHRLVAKAYIFIEDTSLFVDHIDCNPRNNNVSNLRWVTRTENANNSKGKTYYTKNQRIKALKLLLIDQKSVSEVSRLTNITANALTSAVQGKCWLKERELLT